MVTQHSHIVLSVNSNPDIINEDEETAISSPAAAVMRSMLRELLGSSYSIPRIANSIGTSQTTIRRMLQGTTQNPSSRIFDKLLRLYCATCCNPLAKSADASN